MPSSTNILILFGIACNAQLNQWESDTGPNGEDIWRSTSEFIPVQSQSFGSIKIGKEMLMTFDFTWNGYTYDPRGQPHDDYENFFRIGCSAFNDSIPGSPCNGVDCYGSGSRVPSFWVTPESNGPPYMHLSISSKGGSGYCRPSMTLSAWGEIYIGVKLHLNIWWNESTILVDIGHYSNYTRDPSTFPELTIPFTRISGTDPIFFGWDMPVWWMTDEATPPLINRGNGTFDNIEIVSQYFEPPTSNPSAQVI